MRSQFDMVPTKLLPKVPRQVQFKAYVLQTYTNEACQMNAANRDNDFIRVH